MDKKWQLTLNGMTINYVVYEGHPIIRAWVPKSSSVFLQVLKEFIYILPQIIVIK